jgi:hypothetical protein
MPENKKNNDWKKREVAALWSKGDYYTGRLSLNNLDLKNIGPDDTIGIVMFRNKDQNEGGTRPSFNVYKSQNPPEGQSPQTRQKDAPQKTSSKAESVKMTQEAQEDDDENIPAFFK